MWWVEDRDFGSPVKVIHYKIHCVAITLKEWEGAESQLNTLYCLISDLLNMAGEY